MKFQHGTRRRALEYEKDWVQRWKADKTFEKSIEQRPLDNSYVFYDGPPFISGNPHHGTLLSSIVKDAVPRYQTMKGKRVERVWGWDCHGLPAERFTEKKLGLKSREEVIDYGLEKYIIACRNNMVQTSSEWNDVVDRIGRWVDMDNAYKTMDKNYMESVWWAFKELYEKGKIYEGEKVLMYCTLDATPLSKAEVTMDAGAYQDITDPSVYVKFRLNKLDAITTALENSWSRDTAYAKCRDEWSEDNKSAGQCAISAAILHTHLGGVIGKTYIDGASHYFNIIDGTVVDVTSGQFKTTVSYDQYEEKNEDEVLANDDTRKRYEILKKRVDEFGIEKTLLAWTTTPWTLPANTALAVNEKLTYVEVVQNGEHLILAKDLLGKVMQDEKHQPLEYEVIRELKGKELVGKPYELLLGVDRGEGAHKVWAADYVSSEDGTGIVHLAPAYGEEDFELARREKIPVVHTIDENGYFTEGDWTGQNVWETNKQIAKDLKERGVVWKIEYIRHSYPHCHRCGTRLMYRAHPSWFMDINGQRKEMIANNEPINWFPPHVKHGRFEKNIEQAPDWNLSRDRFWATAMPVWKSPSGKVKVVGSYAELKELSGVELEDYHRPWIDDVTFEIDGEVYTRIDKVMDCWFESGSMPFAQFHYPFENKEKFEANFPGDFIVEYIGQVRAWFYYVHAVNTALFGTHAFNNVIVTGNVAGNDGRKMSKSYGNYTDPNELMDKFSADSLRFLLLSSPLLNGEDFALQDKEVGDVARKLSMVWNMYDFFTMYAEVDGWEYDPDKAADLNPDDVKNPLDKWVISRVHQLNQEISVNMDGYNIPDAMSPILPFLDDASNWFVRRSRRRFWKSEDDDDKAQAYRTLHYVLLKFAVLVAPFTPFLAEELYQNLGGGVESVHLLDWPTNYTVDEAVLSDMERVRSYINEGLSIRAREGLKVRQPLASVRVPGQGITFDFAPILTEELNVKAVEYGEEVALDTELTPELKREGMAREVIRHVQSARKVVGLQVDDRIGLTLATDNEELKKAIEQFRTIIETETLAHRDSHTRTVGENDFHTEVKVDGSMLSISLAKEENA